MKELEQAYPGLTVEDVHFDVTEEGDAVRVVATANLERWEAAERDFDWPEDAVERVREILKRVVAHLGLRASVDVVERDGELLAEISGPELGLLIGKHGQTLD